MIIELLTVVLVIVTMLMIGSILLQKPEGNAFGSSASDTLSSILSASSSRNPMARITTILAALFFILCLSITIITKHTRSSGDAIDQLAQQPQPKAAPAKKEEAQTPCEDKQPAQKTTQPKEANS